MKDIVAKRQNYPLSRNHCHFKDKFAEMKHILAAPAAGSLTFRQNAGCAGETVQA
jgi:hypothetical protein